MILLILMVTFMPYSLVESPVLSTRSARHLCWEAVCACEAQKAQCSSPLWSTSGHCFSLCSIKLHEVFHRGFAPYIFVFILECCCFRLEYKLSEGMNQIYLLHTVLEVLPSKCKSILIFVQCRMNNFWNILFILI